MSLQLYKKKRDFKDTPEPKGKISKKKEALVFVVHRHKASRLHYDFRLEMKGVLKSWAVPKGPSLNPGDKRLAMMVEDHPYEYRKFKGIIPEGNYGAGIVEIWDEGEVTDLEDSEKELSEKKLLAGLKAGNLKFKLKGKKLKGEFALVKLKGKEDNAWLLIKHRDKYAVDDEYDSEDFTLKTSPINKWLKENGKAKPDKSSDKKKAPAKKARRVRSLPAATRKLATYIKPMLAKETNAPFSDKNWVYEMKWDGYRAIAEVNKNKVSLYSRNGNTFNDSYPIITAALKERNIQAVLDGEIIVVKEDGKPSFQLLQHYQTDGEHDIQYRVFDLLSLNGQNTCDLPLIERKKLLKQLLKVKTDAIKYSDHIEEDGISFFNVARKNDIEGIMAKQADSLYTPGARTSEWLKIKHHKSVEAIIVGYTEPTGTRNHFGALVLGMYEDKKLKYVGHTGSGFSSQGLKDMMELLTPLQIVTSPFEEKVKTNMPVTWVKPILVCEIKFTEWTRDGNLRHPIFLRLREDKKASEITMENNRTTEKKKSPVSKTKKAPAKKSATTKKRTTVIKDNKNELQFGKTNVKLSNLDKVFWPKEKVTKGNVIAYYQSVSRYILPFLKDRPQSLLRNPNGIKDKGFFHKDAGEEAPPWVKTYPVYSESSKKTVDYIVCNNAATLAYMNNLGCIEINPWHSTIQNPDHPDYLIIDIDPSEKNTFNQVIEAANVVNSVFERVGVKSYCKTSGATGLHVYVPTQKKYTYDQLKDFAHLICILTQEQLPGFTSLERNLKKRGNKMIYLDHLQNRGGQTISCVYSLRPKEGAPVSMPLKWSEVKPGLTPLDFTIENALGRIEKNKDLFTPVLGKGIDLKKCLKLLDK